MENKKTNNLKEIVETFVSDIQNMRNNLEKLSDVLVSSLSEKETKEFERLKKEFDEKMNLLKNK